MTRSIALELEHAGAQLIGEMIRPAGTGPFPAVLVMHNALGIGDHVRAVAQRLSGLGYMAVVTDMYGGGAPFGDASGYEVFASEPELLRARVRAWFDHVAVQPQVDASRIAALGYCFGGTCVLELARSGAAAKAVVSYHGILTTKQPMQQGAFAGEVLAFCGARDPYAPLDHIEALRAEMASAGVRQTITTFGEAQHSFTDPGADRMGREGIAYNVLADRLSWAGTVELLAAVFG